MLSATDWRCAILTPAIAAQFSNRLQAPEPQPTLRGPAAGQRVFARYILQRILGRGGMGVVWLARDETLRDEVALKFLPDAVRWDAGAFDDLKAETRRARLLTHPNVIRIHDFVEDATGAAISMEWVDGPTLTEARLQRTNKIFEPEEIVPWLPALCQALDYAHTQAKVVHRDLKPSNIMLTRDGLVKVGDFGIARSLADSVTRVSMMSAGTLVYMSPQQAMGEEPSPTDDIYALGATLYELLTGKPPFHTGDVRVQLFQRKPDSIAARRKVLGAGKPLPEAWEKTIAACLAKEPADRPASIGELEARLLSPQKNGLRQATRRNDGRKRLARIGMSGTARWIGLSVAVGVTLTAWRWSSRGPSPASPWPSDATRAILAWNLDADGVDASGHGLHAEGVTSAVPTTDRHGRIDRALRFNGTAAIESPDSPLLRWEGDDPFSVAFWVRPESLLGHGSHLVGATPTKVGDHMWHFDLLERGRFRFAVSQLQEEGGINLDGSILVRAGEWAHVAGTSDGRRLRLFVNGVPDGEIALTSRATGRRPQSSRVRLGNATVYAQWAFAGVLDELRVWRRPLASEEVGILARGEAPPRFVLTSGHYTEKDDLPAVIAAEFGQATKLADWDDLRRWHADDVQAWCDEVGFEVNENGALLQRGGERIWEPPRHYSAGRWEGTKPAYFLAHDELGGFTLALGSWYGYQLRALAQLPLVASRVESLAAASGESVTRTMPQGKQVFAYAMTWRAALSRTSRPVRCELRLRDGRMLIATVAPTTGDKLALVLGDAKEPAITRQFAAGWGDYRFTVVVANGLIRFRAVNPMGSANLFQESIRMSGLKTSDVAELALPGVEAAELIVE